jgi:hypothetical protein
MAHPWHIRWRSLASVAARKCSPARSSGGPRKPSARPRARRGRSASSRLGRDDRNVRPARRVLLDTHVIDTLVADAYFRRGLRRAVKTGAVVVVVTHLQIDEILAIPVEKVLHQDALLQELASLPVTRAPTCGGAWGRSRWGASTWMSAADGERLDSLRDRNPQHTVDSVLILTARRENAALVTDDRGARARASRQSVATMAVAELRTFVCEDSG